MRLRSDRVRLWLTAMLGAATVVLLATSVLTLSGCKPTQSVAEPLHASKPHVLSAEDQAFHGTGFVDATALTGIEFVHSTGQDGSPANLMQSNGSGIALLDYDGDGKLDVYFVTGVPKPPITGGTPPSFTPRNRLFHNNGDGTFTDVTDKAGVAVGRYCNCVAVGDYLNNGRPDIFIGCVDGPNVLLRNNGDGTFTDVAQQAGVAGTGCALGATWLDYDNDGKLDLYVANYVKFDPTYKYYYNPDAYPGPLAYEGTSGTLYHNNGDGTFTDVTKQMGLYFPHGRAMGVASCDYDGSGYPSIYIANDSMAKYLFHNEGGKHFSEVATTAGCAFNVSGEGVSSMMGCWGDYDHSGRPSLFVPDASFKSLFHNLGGGLFEDVAASSGISGPAGQYVTWGAGWLDYDNSGDPGLFLTNGAFHHLYGQEAILFKNQNGRFVDMSDTAGPFFKRKLDCRGTAFGDYDNDGVVDVFISTLNGPAVVLKGVNATGNHWITLRLIGHKSNRDGIGARVKATFDGKTRYAWRLSGGAYLSENDPRIHFGLGKATIADLEVRWPSGIVQTLKGVKADQFLTVEEPKS